ncbi:MAG: ABC transporter ATP-binding protein [Lachnospiraceae bacterium]
MRKIIRTDNLYRSYTKTVNKDGKMDDIQVIKGIDLSVEEGEFVGIMGKSGCGKTTLIKTLGLIDKATRGNLYFKEKDVANLWVDELADIRRREIGFVFQDFYLMDSLSVKENIMLPMILDKKEAEKCIEYAEKLAEQFGLSHLLDKNPYELSGGEKQRVAICRALINNPDVILADEPTGNLDSKSGKIVVDEFININEKMGKTIVMVTHDPQMASKCKRIIFLKDGLILEDLKRSGTSEEFYQEVLSHMSDL